MFNYCVPCKTREQVDRKNKWTAWLWPYTSCCKAGSAFLSLSMLSTRIDFKPFLHSSCRNRIHYSKLAPRVLYLAVVWPICLNRKVCICASGRHPNLLADYQLRWRTRYPYDISRTKEKYPCRLACNFLQPQYSRYKSKFGHTNTYGRNTLTIHCSLTKKFSNRGDKYTNYSVRYYRIRKYALHTSKFTF